MTHDGFPVASHEQEQGEHFPTKTLEQPLVPLSYLDVYEPGEIQPGTYATHEGLLRVGNGITLDTPAVRANLTGHGYVEGFASVPFTGAAGSDRINDKHFATTERQLAAIIVARGRGIKTHDWDAMTPNEQREFRGTGSAYTHLGATELFRDRGLEIPVTDEDVADVLENVGTYSVGEAKVGDSLVTVICVVDALGRRVVTGADPHALKVLDSLGYSRGETPPFAFSEIPNTNAGRDFMDKSHGFLADPSWNIPIRRAE